MGRCTGDYLEISDGASTQRYCGTSIPAPLTTTNTITVKLQLEKPQGGVRGTGFVAKACCKVAVTTDISYMPFYRPQTKFKYIDTSELS